MSASSWAPFCFFFDYSSTCHSVLNLFGECNCPSHPQLVSRTIAKLADVQKTPVFFQHRMHLAVEEVGDEAAKSESRVSHFLNWALQPSETVSRRTFRDGGAVGRQGKYATRLDGTLHPVAGPGVAARVRWPKAEGNGVSHYRPTSNRACRIRDNNGCGGRSPTVAIRPMRRAKCRPSRRRNGHAVPAAPAARPSRSQSP